MKPSTIKKLFAFISTIILSVFILIFYNSCSKEASRETKKTNTALKVSSALSSSIIYTDVIPDLFVNENRFKSNSRFYNLDLNSDGINDFTISESAGGTACGFGKAGSLKVWVTPLNSNNTNSQKLLSNSIINNNIAWETVSTLRLVGTYCKRIPFPPRPVPLSPSGTWSDAADGYLPLKLIAGLNTYYGWARLDVGSIDNEWGFKIKDYAYNSIPNQSILAGQFK